MPAHDVSFAPLPTPCHPMDRLGRELGFPSGGLLVKRDDLTALAGGGNKVRKLELLCADALDHGADTLVTGGGRQSNHVRMTAAAANRLGLACTVVLASDPPEVATGNVVLDELLGPEMVWAGDLDYPALEARILTEADRIRADGRKPYAIPIGGASTIGALAYVDAAREIVAQAHDVDLVVVADGSGGTHAGLAAGSAITAKCSASTSARVPTSTKRCRRWPLTSLRTHRCRHPRAGSRSITTTSVRAMANRPTHAARRCCSPPGGKASCSTPCTPERRWPVSSRPS